MNDDETKNLGPERAPSCGTCDTTEVSASVTELMNRPMYGLSQADSILGLAKGTSRRWVSGYRREGKQYPPILRERPGGPELLTWGEFIEVRLLAEYRADGVPMTRLRRVVNNLRDEFGEYPLATARPFLQTNGRSILLREQLHANLESEYALVVVDNKQIALSEVANHFLDSLTFGNRSEVVQLQPNRRFPRVKADPSHGFGEPTVDGIRTENLAELVDAGESIEVLAAIYGLAPSDITEAVAFERWRSEVGRNAA